MFQFILYEVEQRTPVTTRYRIVDQNDLDHGRRILTV